MDKAPSNLPAVSSAEFLPVLDIETALQRRNALVEVSAKIMKKDVDYGVIPGTEKMNLLQPGAEKLIAFFGLSPIMELVDKVEDWTGEHHKGEAFFFYRYRCTMKRGDRVLGVEEASANSWEVKHRYRWVSEAQLHPSVNRDMVVKRDSSVREPAFAIKKRETGGKYGKPAAYWDRFDRAIKDGTAKKVTAKKKDGGDMEAWEIPDVAYRVANMEAADLVNTVMQMAEKRAKVRATRSCTGASEFYTQDMEDMERELEHDRAAAAEGKGSTIEGTSTRVPDDGGAGEHEARDGRPTEKQAAKQPDGKGEGRKPEDTDDVILKLKEAKNMTELTQLFNGIPQDVRRPGTEVFKAFSATRDQLMKGAK